MPTRDLAKLETWVDKRLWAGVSATERALLVNYREALDAVRVGLAKVYEKYAKAGVLTQAEMTKYNRLANLEKDLAEVLGPALSKNGRAVKRLTAEQYRASAFMHAWAIEQSVGGQIRWGLLNKTAMDAAVKATFDAPAWRAAGEIAIKQLRADGLARMDRTIRQGVVRGLSYDKMAKAIREDVLERSAADAIRIARTEAHRAMTRGQVATYDEAEEQGLELRRFWMATLDSHTRDSHAAMDGVESNEDGTFNLAGYTIDGPGDPQLPPEEAINCRCSLRSQIDDYGPKVRRIRDEGVVPYTTYREWEKERK